MLEEIIARWELISAGDSMRTHSSTLLPVIWRARAAMLKIAHSGEERRGADLVEWWAGNDAAQVFAREGDALLMERATGAGSLVAMAGDGRDDEATRIICSVAARLHAHTGSGPAGLMPLGTWFGALRGAAGGVMARCAAAAEELLALPQDVVVLHGDIHHGNVLDFGDRGWLAIDPKGLVGERGFDYANLFCNPDERAADPQRFDRRVAIVSEAAGLDRTRLLKWIAAWAGLSAAFSIEDGQAPDGTLEIAELALARGA